MRTTFVVAVTLALVASTAAQAGQKHRAAKGTVVSGSFTGRLLTPPSTSVRPPTTGTSTQIPPR